MVQITSVSTGPMTGKGMWGVHRWTEQEFD